MSKTTQDHAAWVMDLLEDDDEDCTLITNTFPLQLSFERSSPGGSRPGRSANKRRNPHGRTTRLIEQYFAEKPVYNSDDFRRRFRMSKNLFIKVHDAVVSYDDYFVAKPDATGKMGIPGLLKVTAALRVLAYASSADSVDENLEMSRPSVLGSLEHFCEAIIAIFGAEYLRSPTEDDMQRLLDDNSKRGFVGMLGSVDCMHIEWKNCPASLTGQYKGKEKSLQSCLKRGQIHACGYGIVILEVQGRLTTLIFWINRQYLTIC